MHTHTYEYTPMYILTHILIYKIHSKTLGLTIMEVNKFQDLQDDAAVGTSKALALIWI